MAGTKQNFRRLLLTFEALSDLAPALTSDQEFTEGALRYFLELWTAKQTRVGEELQRFERQTKNSRLLADLACRIEAGHLTHLEVTRFLEQAALHIVRQAEMRLFVHTLHVLLNEVEAVVWGDALALNAAGEQIDHEPLELGEIVGCKTRGGGKA